MRCNRSQTPSREQRTTLNYADLELNKGLRILELLMEAGKQGCTQTQIAELLSSSQRELYRLRARPIQRDCLRCSPHDDRYHLLTGKVFGL